MLLALFWPEADTTHARTSLRNALYALRQSLGDQILRTRGDEEIAVNPDVVRTDLAAVLESLREGRTDDALASYGGDLLPGLIPPDSDGFMRWLDSERTRLKVSMSVTAMARVEELERSGDIAGALGVARRVMAIEPDDERVVRRVMSLLESLGDRAGALNTFESFRARLATDFEAEPAPETIAMVAQLRAPAPPVPATPQVAPKPAPTATPVRPAAPVAPSVAPAFVAEAANPVPNRSVVRGAAAGVVALAVLATIAWSATRDARPPAIGKSAPLTADEGLQVHAAISPNGRLVAYAKGNAQLLHIIVQKIGGGAPWRLTGDSTSMEVMPRWSPDNDQLLYLSQDNAYVSPSLGGTPRIVARGRPGDGKVRSASWSPKGDSVLIVRNDSLFVQPLEGSGSRPVAFAPDRQLHSCVWSPRGPWIACIAGNVLAVDQGPLFGNEAPSAIVLFPASGGAAIDVTGHASQHRSPAWSPDGRFLWILSDRDGAWGEVYAIPISGDGVSGAFHRVGLKAESIALSEGRMAYTDPVRRANIWSVPIPGRQVTTLANVGTRVTSGTGLIELANASSDGKWILYDNNLQGNADIYRIPVGGGAAERLTDDPRGEYAAALSPDGREFAWQRFVNGPRRLFIQRLDEDSAHQFVADTGDQGGPQWSPDGQSIAAWKHTKESGVVFVVHRDASGAWGPPAWRLKGGQLPVWSRDGKSLAFVHPDGRIETIPADSGARTLIYSPRPHSTDPVATYVLWRLDQSVIWFIGSDARGHAGIWSVSPRGGDARLRVKLEDPAGRLPGPTLSTDGSRFYFTLDERFSNVRWAELVKR
jgi:Tol biopolymer transport system component/DNA-binding SARP family transcriptional activator